MRGARPCRDRWAKHSRPGQTPSASHLRRWPDSRPSRRRAQGAVSRQQCSGSWLRQGAVRAKCRGWTDSTSGHAETAKLGKGVLLKGNPQTEAAARKKGGETTSGGGFKMTEAQMFVVIHGEACRRRWRVGYACLLPDDGLCLPRAPGDTGHGERCRLLSARPSSLCLGLLTEHSGCSRRRSVGLCGVLWGQAQGPHHQAVWRAPWSL